MSYSYKYNPLSETFDLVGQSTPGVGLNHSVFKQTFTGNGSDTQFQLTGTENATFVNGSWLNTRVLNVFPSHITKTNKKAIYDSLNILTRNRITVSSISASGLVTLDYPPRDTEQFIIWYWYYLDSTDDLEDYYREDFITEMEGAKPSLIASDIAIADAGDIITGAEVETALQENRTAIDLNTTHSQITTNPHAVEADQISTTESGKTVQDKLNDLNAESHTQNTDTILKTWDGINDLFNAGILKTDLVADNAVNIQIDEIRARDIDGLKLYDDAGNGIFVEDGGNIGIGSTDPVEKLHTLGTLSTIANRIETTDTDTDSLASLRLKTGASTNVWQWFARNGDLFAGIHGVSDYLVIKDGGQVGIGTIIPHASAILELNSTTKGFLPPQMTATQRNAISSPKAGLTIYDTTNNKPDFYNGTVWKAFVSTDISTFVVGSVPFATDAHHISDDNANFFWDNINKRLGIGTNTPSAKLDVQGQVIGTVGNNVNGIQFSTDFTEAGSGNHGLISHVRLEVPTITGGDATLINTANLYIAGAMAGVVTGQNYALWVDGGISRFDGNVGIGIGNPTETLHVDGQARVDRIILNRGVQSSYIEKGNFGSSKGMSFYTVNSHKMILSEGGNLGIGTDNPSAKLDVVGNTDISSDLTIGTNKLFVDVSNGTTNIGKSVTGTDAFNVFAPTTGVQTGIASFYDSSSNIKFRMRDEWTASSIPPRFESHSSLGFALNNINNAPFIWYINDTGNEKMRLTSTGLGIGATSLSSKLHIEGTDELDASISVKSTNADSDAYIITRNDAIPWSLGVAGDNSDAFTISRAVGLSIPKLTINSSGNVGIGTTTPDARLDVEEIVAGTTASLRIHHTDNTNGSHALLHLQTESASGGDPHIRFTVGGQGDWVMGTDNSDTDAFKLCQSTAIGTNTFLEVNYLGTLDCATTTGAFKPNRLTTTQRDALIFTENSMIIYNTTLNKFQGRENGAWVNFI